MTKASEVFRCTRTNRLEGIWEPAGSKNVGLKLLLISPMFDGRIKLSRVPNNNQIKFVSDVLREVGSTVSTELQEDPPGLSLEVETRDIIRPEILNNEINWCRHIFLTSIPILLRTGNVTVPIPGYSHYGPRPVSGQISALQHMGAKVGDLKDGHVTLSLPREGLKGGEIALSYPSVAVTEAILLLSTAIRGRTVISGVAQEPEVVEFCKFLVKAGVKIDGLGTTQLTVESDGLSSLCQDIEWEIIPDRIEIATAAAAVAVCGGIVKIIQPISHHLSAVRATLTQLGCRITEADGDWVIESEGRPKATNITTRSYPGFPTDAQGPFLTALALADGVSVLHEAVWSNRLSQAMELRRLGADIDVYQGNVAVIKGKPRFFGTTTTGTDPRATAGLAIAGLVADGETVVYGADLVDNAYDSLDVKLRNLGANIQREPVSASGNIRVHPEYLRLEAQ